MKALHRIQSELTDVCGNLTENGKSKKVRHVVFFLT